MALPTGFGGRDVPDYGVSVAAHTSSFLNDMTELACRLGALNYFDRTGTILYQDNFNAGLMNWEHNSYPASNFAVLSARYADSRYYSARLNTDTTSGGYSGIQRRFPFSYMSNFGFEFQFKLLSHIDLLYFYCKI